MTSDFRNFAREVATRRGVEGMVAVVEKELVHYDILQALDRSGWLGRLTFQGGTCLRLCYGGVRYSEDLDFNVQEDLARIDLDGFREVIAQELQRRFDVMVRVKEPRSIKAFEGGGTMKRWQVVVDTAPARPDLPSQRVKIEIAAVPSYTREQRLVAENYVELAGMYRGLMVGCQALREILADKLISFASMKAAPRYRDLWDIPWILSQGRMPTDEVATMVARKHDDYGCAMPLADLLADGAARAKVEVGSEAFVRQMERFLPRQVVEGTVAVPEYREAMAHRIVDAYGAVARVARGAFL